MAKNEKIQSISLENFTCFKSLDLVFSPGINVLIGENGTGKTHLMKLLYSVVKEHEVWSKNEDQQIHLADSVLGDLSLAKRLREVFKPDHLENLVNKNTKNERSDIHITVNSNTIDLIISPKSYTKVHPQSANVLDDISTLYIPPTEMLTLYHGFIGAYENRESAYDETYYELAKALNPLPLRGPKLVEVRHLIEPLETAINAKVINKDGKFYLKFNDIGEVEAPMVAEGLKKIGTLIYLISNGSLSSNSVLFWDEPEAHLNPKYINLVVNLLTGLANAGVQVFLATHDYLLSHKLSLKAEYSSVLQNGQTIPDMKFFSFIRKRGGVVVESGSTLTNIENNPILDEFAAFYDEETDLFSKV